jgi:hypothetical protein
MVQDVTELMSELQTVAGSTRDEVMNRYDQLQNLVERAEQVSSNLSHTLENMPAQSVANNNGASPQPAKASSQPQPVEFQPLKLTQGSVGAEHEIQSDPEPNVPMELVFLPGHFGEYLHISGCTSEVVSLAGYIGQWADDQPGHVQ